VTFEVVGSGYPDGSDGKGLEFTIGDRRRFTINAGRVGGTRDVARPPKRSNPSGLLTRDLENYRNRPTARRTGQPQIGRWYRPVVAAPVTVNGVE